MRKLQQESLKLAQAGSGGLRKRCPLCNTQVQNEAASADTDAAKMYAEI